MYNLFVANDVGRWDMSYFTYQIDRVFEYTADNLSKRYKKFGTSARDELMNFPSLFAYEKHNQIDARIGWINNIKVTPTFVVIDHELDLSFPPISATSLNELGAKLDIHSGEMNRTHWAIKNRDLLDVLFEAGLIQQRKPKDFNVFLCYASEDKDRVEILYNFLLKGGIKAWFNRKSILPGQDWEAEIHEAIINSHVILVCLSSQSITKEGFVQKEIRKALDISGEKPDGAIFIIPARLENCEVPRTLTRYQWVDLFLEDGYEKVFEALRKRAADLSIRIKKRL